MNEFGEVDVNGQFLHEHGVSLLVSAAAWGPGLYGPNGEWARCVSDTGLSVFVYNRTGQDSALDFTAAQSGVIKNGRRLLSLHADRSTIFVIEWNAMTQTLATEGYQCVEL